MALLTLFLFFLALWVGYLGVEAIRLRRWQEAIPLRISVTGTRGKSSVVRMLAAVLREDGWTVVGKSTGAEARLILPDGTERPVRRRGRPSILEQVGAVGLAARVGADVLVAEVMSVHAEHHRVESQRLLRPHLVLVTNFRVDHVDAQGSRKEEVARIVAMDVPRGARVLVPEEEWEESFAGELRGKGCRIDRVPALKGVENEAAWARGNRALVRAAGAILELDRQAVDRGIRTARQDAGRLDVWLYPGTEERSRWRVVNAFAANDPESTFLLYDSLFGPEAREDAGVRIGSVGLLCLRGDRGDRTLLWAEALSREGAARFRRIYVHGVHARALRRRLAGGKAPEIATLSSNDPQRIMERILGDWRGGQREIYRDQDPDPGSAGVVFGFGNFVGLGERMVHHWAAVGDSVEGRIARSTGEEGPRGL